MKTDQISRIFLIILLLVVQISYALQRKSTYVKSYTNRNGRYVSGHFRKSNSIKSNSYKSRSRSNYYYHTRGKYRRRK